MVPTNARQLIVLYVLAAVMMVAYAAVFTLLAEIRASFGFSEAAIGLIAGSTFAAGFVAQLGLSRLADIGYGSQLMRVGMGLSVVGALWMVVAVELWEWVTARTVLGFGAGCIRPGVRRYVIVLDPKRAGQRLGTLAAWEMVGFMIGPVLASGLLVLFDLRMPFIAVTACLVLLAPLAVWLRIPGSRDPLPRAVRTLVKRPAMQACLAMGMAFYIAVGVFEAIWAVFMADLGAGPLFIGVTMSLFSLPMIVIAPWAGGLAQRRHVLKLTTLTMTVAIGCMVAYGQLESIWWLCLPLAIHGMVDAVTMPATQLAVGYASGEGALAAGQGLFGAAGLIVAMIASLCSGAVYQTVGAAGLWSIASLLMVACVVFARVRGNHYHWRGMRELGEPEHGAA